jgi:deoxyribodipyrimidine photo-lyase
MLASFIKNRIKIFDTGRNDPNVKALSDCSPWFHTDQLSVQRSVLQVRRSAGTYEAKGIAVHPMDMVEDEEDSEDEEDEEEEPAYRDPKTPAEAAKAFIEEAIVRSELSDNYCYYNENNGKIEGAADWAIQTLNDHRKDKREWLYTRDELDEAKTHDELWNSAQIQLKTEGKMHGFMRMYWCKKILEWT